VVLTVEMSTFNRPIIPASPASTDYLHNRTQFQLHSLLTEQRHPQTWNLSEVAAENPLLALQQLFSVDKDIVRALRQLADNPQQMILLQRACEAVQQALRGGHHIYFYGTGATGRLALSLESAIWRPFWQRLRVDPVWPQLSQKMADMENRIHGIITGGDRALISSLEGFEDLPLMGALQLSEQGISADDVLFAVTEGGETSAVIGAALAAAKQTSSTNTDRVWFVYNNPDEVLRPLARCCQVLDEARVQKLCLPTGPQAITGSTRMQAATISLYVLGLILEEAARALLRPHLSAGDAVRLALDEHETLAQRLRDFAVIQHATAAAAPQLVAWTAAEAHAYRCKQPVHYYAQAGLMQVFVDVTERSPTFRLPPLDPVDIDSPQSMIQVHSLESTAHSAWDSLLHRPFQGLSQPRYQAAFTAIDDLTLRQTALRSLAHAGPEQQLRYDLSLTAAHSVENHRSLNVLLRYTDETLSLAQQQGWDHIEQMESDSIVVHIGPPTAHHHAEISSRDVLLSLPLRDPIGLNRTVALKMLLNAHSTALMARLGRTVGNTMTAVQPGNLKLIGRATFLIQSHINAVLASPIWHAQHGPTPALSYAEANALLFTAMQQRATLAQTAPCPEVELAIVAALEHFSSRQCLNWYAAAQKLEDNGLNTYLRRWKNL